MNLKSYPKFAEYAARMKEQTNRLSSQLEEVETDIQGLMREYASLFQEGKDTTSVMADIQALKGTAKVIKGEIEIIEGSDFREKELAREVYAQFSELEREVLDKQNRLWEQSEKIKDDTEAAIVKINDELADLLSHLTVVARDQFGPVIEHLDFHEDTKSNLRLKAYGGLTGSYSSVRNITRN
jgi:chromosome segregation ATPase